MAKSIPMDRLRFWQQKLLQILHDPPAKPYDSLRVKIGKPRGGHEKVAQRIASLLAGFELESIEERPSITQESIEPETEKSDTKSKTAKDKPEYPIRYIAKLPDLTTAGADRPVFPSYKNGDKPVIIWWPKKPVITHPLSPGYRLMLNRAGVDEDTAGVDARKIITEIEDAAAEDLAVDLKDPALEHKAWGKAEDLQRRFVMVWRQFRHILTNQGKDGDPNPVFRHLWQTMPADSRCPDHSIWEHNRLSSALAFMTSAKSPDAPRCPWLFRFEIGPVGRFIDEARTSRDLWMGSFLLSDLIWHAMAPVVEQYGPDCIIYPDLCENPMVDVWLKQTQPETLPEEMSSPATYAAVLPNTFTAVLPLGLEHEKSHLLPLKAMAQQAKMAMEKRWQDLSNIVKHWLTEIQGESQQDSQEWHRIWDEQNDQVFHATWTAIRWSQTETINHKESLDFPDPLPCQEKRTYELNEDDSKALAKRKRRLKPFVPDAIWSHYNIARSVFLKTNFNFAKNYRGLDYALTHHQLRVRHAMRKLETPDTGIFNQRGEKCTVCGKRQAVYSLGSHVDRLHTHRAAARSFWAGKTDKAQERLNPDPVQKERLCGVCATKRFLVEAGKDDHGYLTVVNTTWAGIGSHVKDLGFKDNIPRVPFPSTATLAAQQFLSDTVKEPDLMQALSDVIGAWEKAGLPQTGFPRSLRRLANLESSMGKDSISAKFLMLDTQQSLFPETVDIAIRRAKDQKDAAKEDHLKDLKEQVVKLRSAVRDHNKELPLDKKDRMIKEPNTQIAIVRMDGDHMGRLLLGDSNVIQTRWKDVLHPDAIDSKRSAKKTSILTNAVTKKAGWPDLLDAKRIIGPSLHAYISRALAVFSHRIVPWVVEQEFPGRLIYAGGDDLLAMVPAIHALPMAARLQQLFSAPFLLDTMPEAIPWGWRPRANNTRPSSSYHYESPRDEVAARSRFVIPQKPEKEENIILPVFGSEDLEPYLYSHFAGQPAITQKELDGEILMMLGKGHSLSAGIAIGHFKHPLQNLLEQSKIMLKTWAKGISGRNAVGVSHFSRNGIKTRFAMPWSSGSNTQFQQNTMLSNVEVFQNVVEGFRKEILPKRLPYKLHEYRTCILELDQKPSSSESSESQNTEDDPRTRFINGLFNTALDSRAKNSESYTAAALDLWKQGMSLELLGGNNEPLGWADGLFIARTLSALEEEA